MEQIENEVWKPVVDYESLYEISNHGRVKSLHRYVRGKFVDTLRIEKGRIRIPKLNKFGYYTIALNRKGTHKWVMVHRLVLEAFSINPENKPHVNHINSIRTDNRLENLEWCTPKENMAHCKKIGRTSVWYKRGDEKHPNGKLDEYKVRDIRRMYYEEKMGQIDIAKQLNVNKNAVSAVITWRTWFYIDPELKEYYKSIKPTKHKNNG